MDIDVVACVYGDVCSTGGEGMVMLQIYAVPPTERMLQALKEVTYEPSTQCDGLHVVYRGRRIGLIREAVSSVYSGWFCDDPAVYWGGSVTWIAATKLIATAAVLDFSKVLDGPDLASIAPHARTQTEKAHGYNVRGARPAFDSRQVH